MYVYNTIIFMTSLCYTRVVPVLSCMTIKTVFYFIIPTNIRLLLEKLI